MAFLEFKHVSIEGIAACVPRTIDENSTLYAKWGGYENFFATTGIARRHISSSNVCSSDLCMTAAENLLSELHWSKEEIDAVIFVSQTPDYIAPATSCIIQDKLGLKGECYTLDISLGCSGWVYALSVIAALMQNGTIKKGLLLAGDTVSKMASPDDKSAYPLFGDAGTATALKYTEADASMRFCMNSDGAGYEAIILKDGGYRNPVTEKSLIPEIYGDGIIRNRLNVGMDGMSVFSFGISKAPKVVNELLEHYSLIPEAVDYYTFHQANLFMNEKIRKKLKLPVEKVPYSLRDFGNTSCASIPLTMVTQLRDELQGKHLKHVGCGFGVGLSWGAVHFETKKIVCPNLIEFENV